jgi:hypothetical protein
MGKQEKREEAVGEAPRFIIPLEDITVSAGGSIDLECKVGGVPMPQLKW